MPEKTVNDTISILFVCHGNICRSPMAEFIMKKLVKDAGLENKFYIDSKATSTEELGNAPYPPAKRKLQLEGIPMTEHRASQIKKSDYQKFDYIIGMDEANIKNMLRIFGQDKEGKIYKMLEFTKDDTEPSYRAEDIADPWYSGDFDTACTQITKGCAALLNFLKSTVIA